MRVALRRDDQEARRTALCALADAVDERRADDSLVGDDQNILGTALGFEVDDDVLNRSRAGYVANPVDCVLAQPAGFLVQSRQRLPEVLSPPSIRWPTSAMAR